MDIALEPVVAAKPRVQPNGRDDVGDHPIVRGLPALGNHALRGEVDHVRGLFAGQQSVKGVEVMVDVEPAEPDRTGQGLPFVGQQRLIRLLGAAGRDHLVPEARQVIAERGARKRIRSQDKKTRGTAHRCNLLFTSRRRADSRCINMCPMTSWTSSATCMSSIWRWIGRSASALALPTLNATTA